MRFVYATVLLALLVAVPASAETVLIEAEQFNDYGGWVDDSQFMDHMGSPFLLAHGLGKPVADATTTVTFPATGTYHVWVRTRDWVATWKAPGAPGRFKLVVDGKPLDTTFGTDGANWHWQRGGTVTIKKGDVKIALHDLTGFEGRCDAIIFSTDVDFLPPNADPAMASFRRKMLGLSDEPLDGGEYDLVVVGGGISGTCASLAAARLGLKVGLVQDRPVLGGNNSSEVRVWLHGARNRQPWPRVGDIVNELECKVRAHYGPANKAENYEDDKRLALVRGEKNLTLLLRHRANKVETDNGRIKAVIAQHTRTGKSYRIAGRWFADCTGDGCVGYMAGAKWDMTEKGHMGRCNLWHIVDTGKPVAFPRCPWALDLSDNPFPGRGEKSARKLAILLGGWYWESGFDHDPFEKSEYIRDWNFRAAYGAWDAIKNVDKLMPDHEIGWMAHIAGKRESRRLLGDVVLTREDLVSGKVYPDACVPLGWKMDLHLPDKRYDKGFEGDAFISKATFDSYKMPYFLPYRCLYSRNVPNLFMAGRDVSVTHDALGAVRVMRTGGCMGEIVGMAASLCKKNNIDPRGVYESHLDDLKELMKKGVGNAPAATTHPGQGSSPKRATAANPDPELIEKRKQWLASVGENLAPAARVTASGCSDPDRYPLKNINDGRVDLNNDARWLSAAGTPHWVEFRWDQPQTIAAVRIVSGYVTGGKPTAPIESFLVQVPGKDGHPPSVIAGASENRSAFWHSRFKPVKTDCLRLLVNGTHGDISRIWEVGIYEVPEK